MSNFTETTDQSRHACLWRSIDFPTIEQVRRMNIHPIVHLSTLDYQLAKTEITTSGKFNQNDAVYEICIILDMLDAIASGLNWVVYSGLLICRGTEVLVRFEIPTNKVGKYASVDIAMYKRRVAALSHPPIDWVTPLVTSLWFVAIALCIKVVMQ